MELRAAVRHAHQGRMRPLELARMGAAFTVRGCAWSCAPCAACVPKVCVIWLACMLVRCYRASSLSAQVPMAHKQLDKWRD